MTLYVVVGGETTVELPGVVGVGAIPKLGESNSVPISKVIADCLASKATANLRSEYIRSLRFYLEGFARGRERMPITAVNLEIIEKWFAGRKETPSSRRSNIGRLSSLFSYAWRRGFVKENPCRRLERIRVDPKPPRILTPLEARTILHYMAKDGRRRWRLPQIALGLFAGIRPTELTRLHWRDIDLTKQLVRIDASASKIRRRRIVPLSDNCVSWLRLCKPHTKPLGAKRWKWIRNLERGTGIKWDKDILRHSAASYLLSQHEDVGRVARWLGNSPDILLNHYAELVCAQDALAFWKITP